MAKLQYTYIDTLKQQDALYKMCPGISCYGDMEV